MAVDTLWRRFNMGWSAEDALTTPVKVQKNNRSPIFNRFGEKSNVAEYWLKVAV